MAVVLACTAPAQACTPILSVGMPALGLAWLVWLLLTPFLGRPGEWKWAALVPLGFLAFAVPMFAVFLLPAALALIAFPMHLAVEFFDAAFHGGDQRGRRLLYYGLPLAMVLVFGVMAKAALYGDYGGLRALAWNYAREAEAGFFAVWLAVGAWTLWRHRFTVPLQTSEGP